MGGPQVLLFINFKMIDMVNIWDKKNWIDSLYFIFGIKTTYIMPVLLKLKNYHNITIVLNYSYYERELYGVSRYISYGTQHLFSLYIGVVLLSVYGEFKPPHFRSTCSGNIYRHNLLHNSDGQSYIWPRWVSLYLSMCFSCMVPSSPDWDVPMSFLYRTWPHIINLIILTRLQ